MRPVIALSYPSATQLPVRSMGIIALAVASVLALFLSLLPHQAASEAHAYERQQIRSVMQQIGDVSSPAGYHAISAFDLRKYHVVHIASNNARRNFYITVLVSEHADISDLRRLQALQIQENVACRLDATWSLGAPAIPLKIFRCQSASEPGIESGIATVLHQGRLLSIVAKGSRGDFDAQAFKSFIKTLRLHA